MRDAPTIVDNLMLDIVERIEEPPPVSLADKFGVPPLSVLDRRSGLWRTRKRKWLSLGIQSEVGRSTPTIAAHRTDFIARASRGEAGNGKLLADGTSIFDPVLAELAYRWYSLPGDRIFDPFAGGSVRGVVASTLGRWYLGWDIREDQVAANRAQAHLGSDITPQWEVADSTRIADEWRGVGGVDMILTCPPYGDLEVYSDHPRDISTWTWQDFLGGQIACLRGITDVLADDRYVVWVTSDVRDRRGAYRGLVGETVRQAQEVGLSFQSEAIMLDQVGHAAMRAERTFRGTRRLTRVHQHVLIFVKGSPNRAARRIEGGST